MRLISQEGHVFVVERRAACVSKLIETMLSSGVLLPCFAHDASPHLAPSSQMALRRRGTAQ